MILSTSNRNKKAELQRVFYGLIISIGCAAFGGIYEIFGHGVYSGYMIYAFMLPLLLCVIPGALMILLDKPAPDHLSYFGRNPGPGGGFCILCSNML